MEIQLPKQSMIMLIGAAASGKSTFAAQHFLPSEIVSSDQCRLMIFDDETVQSANKHVFELVHLITSKRLQNGRLTVIDATNVKPHDRRELLDLAWQHRVPVVAIVFDLPKDDVLRQNRCRKFRVVEENVVSRQLLELEESIADIEREGFDAIYVFATPTMINQATIKRET